MYVGVKGHLFCFSLRFKTWYELFVLEIENFVQEGDAVENEEVWSLIKTVFKVGSNTLQFVWAWDISPTDMLERRLKYMPGPESTIHFCRQSTPAGEMVDRLDHMYFWDAESVPAKSATCHHC